ncbi:MAG: VWA domain-containing protein [Acutalibacteraceae bacterium]|nr:VWA domain-containing protein [Clostridia bacterium]MEE3449436.1 VWA domain-containing protein [Acutalibacteraceae bacterium]
MGLTLTKNPELNKKLSLRKDILLDEVKKSNVSASVARVVFVLDHSGSMRTMYKDGTVQNILERIFPVAMLFDDNAELEFYWFDKVFKELEPVTYDNLDGYVQNVILSQKDHFGETCYAPVMNEIINRYAKTDKSKIPTFVIFITDGANSDKTNSKAAITEASQYNIFWKYIGIGKETFPFLEKLDTLKGRTVDNANFVSVNDLEQINDNQLYSLILEEYNDWLTACRGAGISVDP